MQFVCSIFLINFTVIYQKQIHHGLGRQIGYAKDKLVYHELTADLQRNNTALKNDLISSGAVESFTESNATVTNNGGFESGLKWAGMDPNVNPGFALFMENGNFVRTNGLTLVACMGLLGLATYTTENRTREIGIRKVLGSSVSGIVSLLTRDFARLILLSILIASPLAWLFMHNYLSHFPYRTSLDAWVLAASGGAALLLAFLTISFQVIRTALQNPVKHPRTE